MIGEQHISSLVVLHRREALAALQAWINAHAELDIAASGDCRCVVLCETDNQRAVMDHIEALQMLPGILNVSLIYHHAESRAELDEPMVTGDST